MFQLDSNVYDKQRSLSDYMRSNQAFDTQQQAAQQDIATGAQKQKQARILELASMATPENWSALSQQAYSEGLAQPGTLPPAYDKSFLDNLTMSLSGGSAQNGGSTDYVVRQLMAEDPNLTYAGALQRLKGGLNQGILMDAGGGMSLAPGYTDARQAIKLSEAMGGKQADLTMNPQIKSAEYGVDLANKPVLEEKTSRAGVVGKDLGEKDVDLASREAMLPQLEDTVTKLSELGKKATYTLAGRGVDAAGRELGLDPREAAIARTEYIALVDNQILPLLRQTFGAQFTQKEGESLKVTLGDPNKTPEEKDAVLRSFIDQKKATIESLRRETGRPTLNTTIPQTIPDTEDLQYLDNIQPRKDGEPSVDDLLKPKRRWKVVQ